MSVPGWPSPCRTLQCSPSRAPCQKLQLTGMLCRVCRCAGSGWLQSAAVWAGRCCSSSTRGPDGVKLQQPARGSGGFAGGVRTDDSRYVNVFNIRHCLSASQAVKRHFDDMKCESGSVSVSVSACCQLALLRDMWGLITPTNTISNQMHKCLLLPAQGMLKLLPS